MLYLKVAVNDLGVVEEPDSGAMHHRNVALAAELQHYYSSPLSLSLPLFHSLLLSHPFHASGGARWAARTISLSPSPPPRRRDRRRQHTRNEERPAGRPHITPSPPAASAIHSTHAVSMCIYICFSAQRRDVVAVVVTHQQQQYNRTVKKKPKETTLTEIAARTIYDTTTPALHACRDTRRRRGLYYYTCTYVCVYMYYALASSVASARVYYAFHPLSCRLPPARRSIYNARQRRRRRASRVCVCILTALTTHVDVFFLIN